VVLPITPAGDILDQDNLTESSGIFLSVQNPIPPRAPSLSEIDTSGFADFGLHPILKMSLLTLIDFAIPSQIGGEDVGHLMSDDISSETSSLNCHRGIQGEQL
jgi:hypothetical protein